MGLRTENRLDMFVLCLIEDLHLSYMEQVCLSDAVWQIKFYCDISNKIYKLEILKLDVNGIVFYFMSTQILYSKGYSRLFF